MVLEIRRALEEIKSGGSQGYKRLYNATYEEVYCRSLLIIQNESQTMEFIRDLYKDVFGALDEADDAADKKQWFLHRYYQKLRRSYHRLLEKQEKDRTAAEDIKTLSEVLTAFPLLHRIILVMSYKDDFSAEEISGIYGLQEEKIQSELEKLERLLPSLVKGQPESEAAYVESWKVLLLGACEQIAGGCSDQWVESLYTEAAQAAGVLLEPAEKESDDFDYFIADPEPEPVLEKPKKKIIPIAGDDEEEDEEDEEEEEEEYDEDEEDDEEDDRYDWDVEDDGKRMIILGFLLAVVIVAVVGFAAFRILGNKDKEDKDPVQTEQGNEDNEDKLIVKGGDDSFGEEEPEEPVEEPEEEPEEAPEEPSQEEPQTTVMKVKPNSMNVRSAPNTDCEVVASAKAGERLEVIEDAGNGWVKIRCIDQNGQEGYAKLENLTAE